MKTKQQFALTYQKSVIQERALLKDLEMFVQMQRRPELQKIKHYILEGNILAANERQKEN